MALVHADNFSIYGTSASLLLNGIYASANNVALVTDPDGISGGQVMRIVNNNPSGVRFVLPSAQATVGVCARIWAPNLNFSNNVYPAIAFLNSGSGTTTLFDFDTTGRIRLRTSSTIVDTTVNPVITATGWYHIEIKLTAGVDATDSYEVRVEGVTVMSGSSVDLGTDSIFQVSLGTPNFTGNSGNPTTVYWKDFVVWDGSGSYNNDFLGSVLVHSLVPDGDTSLNWTPSTGSTGWEILSNIPPNDSEYISAPYDSGGPPYYPDPYQGSLTDLPVETTSVKGLITFVRAAKSDGGDGSLQVGIVSDPSGSPATALGADRPITVAQTYWRDVFEVDPVTSSPWLPDAVNQADIQIDRTS